MSKKMGLDSDSLTAGRILATLLVAALMVPVSRLLNTWSRLRHIDGPMSGGWHKLWLVRAVMGRQVHRVLQDVTVMLGPVVRIGPNEVVTSDPELIRRINARESGYRRADSYIGQRVDPAVDSIRSQRDSGRHDALRAKLAPAYSPDMLSTMEAKVDANVEAFMGLIGEKYLSGNSAAETKVFDLGKKVSFFTLDTLFDVVFGQACGFLKTDSDVYQYLQRTQENESIGLLVSVLPSLQWVLTTEFMKKWFIPQPWDNNGLGKILGAAKIIAGSRYGPRRVVRNCVVDSFVSKGLTEMETETEIVAQIIAGSEPTATTICHTLLCLFSNPVALGAVRSEMAKHDLSKPVTNAEAPKMAYLEAVIKESIRMWPPQAGLMSKVVPEQGDTFKGIYLPPGTVVGCSMFAAFSNKDIFGHDAQIFRPERWLFDHVEDIKNRESTLELAFGVGRWQCLGKDLAMMQIRKVVIETARIYDIAIGNATNPWEADCVGHFYQTRFWVRAMKVKRS